MATRGATPDAPARRRRGLRSVEGTYYMLDYASFRLLGRLGDVPAPYYVGHGVAIDPRYHSAVIEQPPMSDHLLVKIALSPGGAVWTEPGGPPRALAVGEATLTFVENDPVAEGYHPRHRGDYEYVGLIATGTPATRVARQVMRTYGRVYDIGADSALVRELMRLARTGRPPDRVHRRAGDAAGERRAAGAVRRRRAGRRPARPADREPADERRPDDRRRPGPRLDREGAGGTSTRSRAST